MMLSSRRKKRRGFSSICFLIPISCLLLLLNASLPELKKQPFFPTKNLETDAPQMLLSEFGEMIISMLPQDLPFTVFLPSQEAFLRTLRLQPNATSDEQKNGTFAMLSRVMGFSAVPKHLPSNSVLSNDEIVLYSVSGHTLYLRKDSDGALVVNNIRSKEVDVRRGELIIHVIRGVIMDAEFARSLVSDSDFEE